LREKIQLTPEYNKAVGIEEEVKKEEKKDS